MDTFTNMESVIRSQICRLFQVISGPSNSVEVRMLDMVESSTKDNND